MAPSNSNKAAVAWTEAVQIKERLDKLLLKCKKALTGVLTGQQVAVYLDSITDLQERFVKLQLEALNCYQNSGMEEEAKDEEISSITTVATPFLQDIDAVILDLRLKLPSDTTVRKNVPENKTSLPKISIREFDTENPSLWFAELEQQFQAFNVSEETDMFILLCGKLGADQTLPITEVILHTNDYTKPYGCAKENLLGLYELTIHQRLDGVLSLKMEAEEKPSKFLGRLKVLCQNITMDDLLQYCVRRELSQQVQLTLLNDSSITSAETLAKTADVLTQVRVSDTNLVKSSFQAGQKIQSKGKRKINGFKTELCYFHAKFGDKAVRCAGTPSVRCPKYFQTVNTVSENDQDEQGLQV